MAMVVNRNAGLLVLGIYLILVGISGFIALGLPPVVMALLAFIAGILLVVGR